MISTTTKHLQSFTTYLQFTIYLRSSDHQLQSIDNHLQETFTRDLQSIDNHLQPCTIIYNLFTTNVQLLRTHLQFTIYLQSSDDQLQFTIY